MGRLIKTSQPGTSKGRSILLLKLLFLTQYNIFHTFIISDSESFPGVSLIGLGVDIKLVSGAHDELRLEILERPAEPGQNTVISAWSIPDQDKVSLWLKVQVFNLKGDDGALAGADSVEALKATGVLARVIRGLHDLKIDNG